MYKITSYHCIALKQGLVNKEKRNYFRFSVDFDN